jgi:hypothetical protein
MYTGRAVFTRRHTRFLIALLLPLMVLRAMLPAGYMPVAENGALRIIMCSDGIYASAADQGAKQTTTNNDHKAPPNYSDCPFAHAAVDAPPVVVTALLVDAPLTLAFNTSARAQLPLTTGPPRQLSARGPPTIS